MMRYLGSLRIVLAVSALGVVAAMFWVWTIWSVYYAGGRTIISEPAEDASIEVVALREGFFVLVGAGGNITVSAGSDGLLLVDTGYGHMTSAVRAALDELGGGPVLRVVTTHSHEDHRGGNATLTAPGAEIMAHANTRANMVTDTESPATEADLPTVIFEDRHSFQFNNQTVDLIHVPMAHTNGDVVVVFQPGNVIAAGDVLKTDKLPFLSRGAGATLDGHLAGQSLLLALSGPDTKIVPGHGSIADRSVLAEINKDLQRIRNHIARLKPLNISRRLRVLFHPVFGWPRERQMDGDWERFWYNLVWDTLP